MRRLFTIVFVSVVLLTSCMENRISDRIWSGLLMRTEDDKVLSEVCMRKLGDTLQIYSNAIFGAENEILVCTRHARHNYTFESVDGTVFYMNFAWSKDSDLGLELLTIEGPDYYMKLTSSSDYGFSSEMLDFYRKRSVPVNAAYYFSGRWYGHIVRLRDEELMSPVCIEFAEDTMRVFANAIFGKRNEVLVNEGFRNGVFDFANAEGHFLLEPDRIDDQIILAGDGFAICLEPLYGDWKDTVQSFYKAYDVARDAEGYIFGSYYGEGVGRVCNSDVLCLVFGVSPDMMDIYFNVNLDFLEGNRVRMTLDCGYVNPQMQMLTGLFGGVNVKSSDIYEYKITDGVVHIDQDSFRILSNGDLLSPGGQEQNIEYSDVLLHKQ